MIAGMPATELLVYTHITQLINLLHTEFRRKHEKCQRRLSSSELVFKFYFFEARKIQKLFFEYTCTCILHICKISQHYTFTCGVHEKDKYTFLMGLLFLLLGQKFVIFVQPINHNIFRRNLTRSCRIHISF